MSRFSFLLSAAALVPVLALAQADIPAQPVTDLKTTSRRDPNGDADPFHIIQLDDRLCFVARNNAGWGFYVRNLGDARNIGLVDPVVDLSIPKHTPVRVSQFPKTQTWDGNQRHLVRVDSRNLGEFRSNKPTEGTLYFHVPSRGLYMSKGTAPTTRRLLDVDVARDNSENRWLDVLAGYREAVPVEGRVFFNGDMKKRGRELFVATSGARPKASLFADVVEGAGDSSPYQIVSSFQSLYFAARVGASPRCAIYKSDGYESPVQITAASDFPPENLTGDGSGGLFYTQRTSQGGMSNLHYLGENGPAISYSLEPMHLTMAGALMLFSGQSTAAGNVGREVWAANQLGTTFLLHDINPGGSSDPAGFTVADRFTYFSANNGALRVLHRTDGQTVEPVREAGTNLVIRMDETCEVMPVMDEGPCTWVYFTGIPINGTEKLLFRVLEDDLGRRAERVLTPAGFPVKNARNLGKFVSAGFNTYRLYFSCDGQGTEFHDPDATEKRFRPRGFELWCVETPPPVE